MTRRLPICVLALTLLAACEEEEPPAPPPAPPPPPEPIVAGRTMADDAAFALVPVPDGALLIWASPHREGGGVKAVTLSPTGAAMGSDRPVARRGAAAGGSAETHPSQAVELDAFAVGRRVGVAWVLDFGHDVQVQATWSADGGERFGAVQELGQTVREEPGTRGRVVVSETDHGQLVVQHRSLDGDCVRTSGRCAMIHWRRLGSDGEAGGRPGPLEIQAPCQPLIADGLHREGTSYRAYCHEQGHGPSTMLYTIRNAVSYAEANPQPGCVPLGLSPVDEGVLAVMRCRDELTAIAVDEMGRVRDTYRPAERSVRCHEGRPVLQVAEDDRESKLRLAEATAQLEALLPEDIAPPGSRAIWTGETVLVAVPQSRSVSVRRYECLPDGRFDRTDVR